MEQRTNAADDYGTLALTLLDRRTSLPLGGARITCVWRDRRMTRYDADRSGSFRTRIPEGVYDLVISSHGYLSLLVRGIGVLAGHEQVLTRALVPGNDSQTPDVAPATAVGGYVTDRLGRGVPGVTVHLTSEAGDATYTTRTNRSGAYIHNAVVPQIYEITIRVGDRRITREHLAIAGPRDFVRHDVRIVAM